jgi:hypothetical protein
MTVETRWRAPHRVAAIDAGESRAESRETLVKRLLQTHGLRLAAALVAAAALGGALYRLPALERAAHKSVNAPSYSLESADLEPLRFFVSIGALVMARNTIPPGSTWTIVVGHDPPLAVDPAWEADTALAVPEIVRMWLLPLRYTPEIRNADWVIAYHHSADTLGVEHSKEIYLSYGATLVKVRR